MGLLQWLQNVVTLNHTYNWAFVWKYVSQQPSSRA